MNLELSVTIDRAIIDRHLHALSHGKPVAPPDGRWTASQLLTLAGTISALLAYNDSVYLGDAVKGEPKEHSEAKALTLHTLIRAATDVTSAVALMLLSDGNCDMLFTGQSVQITLREEGEDVILDPPLGGI